MSNAIAKLFAMLLCLLILSGRRRAQVRRRRALWLASVGIDAGPRTIHGVKVATR